ncbi:MAG: FecR domain-containing protein [Gammaproteobacteria bacterium]|nr:FecR domain-containing protein [Gammaproteobacteria bacterium]
MIVTRRFLLLMVLIFSSGLLAQTEKPAGTVQVLKGRATATSASGNIRNITKGSKLYSSETISTASGSYSRLLLKDQSWIMLRPDSRFYLQNVKYEEDTQDGFGFFSLLKGGFRAVSGLIFDKPKYRYSTAVATIGIRGTSFMVRICNGDCYDIQPVPDDGLYLEVLDQTVVMDNFAGQTTYTAGQFVYIADDKATAQLLDSRPEVFVQSPIPAADPAECL